MNEIKWDMVNAIASVVSAAGVLFAAWQIFAQRRAWKDDHERARRIAAIENLREFLHLDNQNWAATRKLIEELSRSQLDKMAKREPFEIEGRLRPLLFAAVPQAIPEGEQGTMNATQEPYHLNHRQLFALRWQALSYLNHLEVVLQAVDADVAQKEIVHTEIRPFFIPREGKTLMDSFRLVEDGRTSWPSIERFVEDCRTNNSPPNRFGPVNPPDP